jgi:hypothetical protein
VSDATAEGTDQIFDGAAVESAVDFGVGVAGIGHDRLDVDRRALTSCLGLDHLAFVSLSGHDVENHLSRVLPVGRANIPLDHPVGPISRDLALFEVPTCRTLKRCSKLEA